MLETIPIELLLLRAIKSKGLNGWKNEMYQHKALILRVPENWNC
jgi:hypothetical protein